MIRVTESNNEVCHTPACLRILGRQWALWAGAQVLEKMAHPTSDLIQSCSLLFLYWHSVDDPDRHSLFMGKVFKEEPLQVPKVDVAKLIHHEGIAYKAARNMVLDSNYNSPDDISVEDGSEMIRRIFWATWMANSVSSDHCLPGSWTDSSVSCLPLPVSETAFREKCMEAHGTLHSLDRPTRGLGERNEDPISVMAECMKLMLIW